MTATHPASSAPDSNTMPLTKELYFPTPIYFQDLDDAAGINQMLKVRINSWREHDDAGIHRSNVVRVGAWHSPTTMLDRSEFGFFSSIVDQHMNAIFADQQYHDGHVAHAINMWVNVNPRHAYNRSHTHPGALWGGVYYVQTPDNSGRINFIDPRAQAHTLEIATVATDRGPEHWTEVHYQPIAGRMIVFPAWLRHDVEPNLSDLPSPDGNRISISFNYAQRPAGIQAAESA